MSFAILLILLAITKELALRDVLVASQWLQAASNVQGRK